MPSNFIPENHAICVTMWENMVEPHMSQMMVQCMCFACWISKATDTHSEYEIIIAFPLQQWLHKHT